MASVNKVILIGNLGRDPEVRHTPNGDAVCNLRLATTRKWKDKTSNEMVEETEWHSVVLYQRQAEIAGQYLTKGSPVYIEGRLKTRKWQDKDGADRYTTEVVADSMQLLGGRDGGGQGGGREEGRGRSSGGDEGGRGGQRGGRAPAPQQESRGRGGNSRSGGTSFDNMDDDIPF